MTLAITMMDSVATLQRATIGRDANYGVTQNYNITLGSNVPCSVQEKGAMEKALYGQRNAPIPLTVYFISDPGLQINDRISAKNVYTNVTQLILVTGKSRPDTRGTLWMVDGETIPQPT